VDAADYIVWRNSLGTSGSGLAADGNGDGTVTPADYDVWRQHFGESSGSGVGQSANVPESSSFVLCLLCAIGFATTPWRKRFNAYATPRTYTN
jgi:hypothetical protein